MRRWHDWTGACIGLAVAFLAGACAEAPSSKLTSRSGTSLDVISLSRDPEAGKLVNAAELGLEGVVLVFLSKPGANSLRADSEINAAFEIASEQAQKYGDSLIVIERNVPWVGQWTRIVSGERYGFRRLAAGGWQPLSQ